MATYKSQTQTGRYYQLDVTFNGTGTITATLSSKGGEYSYYSVYNLYVKIGNTVLWDYGERFYDTGSFPTLTGSVTKTVNIGAGTSSVAVVFTGRPYTSDSSTTNNGGTFNLDWTKYTISYNANGGTGAPSSQTKTYGVNLTLSSTKPTRTGYTFQGWGTSASATSTTTTYTGNSNATFYAVWKEHVLTVNYYSNYATSAFDGAENTVGADKNVKVHTASYYYDNSYDTYGLANYSGSDGSVYMTRTGYTATGNWGTSTSGGTLVSENKTFVTGQAIAEAFGKSLKTGNASINLYPQWDENILTINYYSNKADYCTLKGEVIDVSSSDNVKVHTSTHSYSASQPNGLADAQNLNNLYMTRTGYDPTGDWGTTTTGGTLVNEKTSFDTGQAMAEALGKSLKNGNASVNIYVQWKYSGVIYIDNGITLEPYLPYIDNGTSWDIYLAYVDNGSGWDVIS